MTIAIDFDAVIHKYSKGWDNGEIYDEPVPGSLQSIQLLIELGYSVFIFSTRESKQIVEWMDRHFDSIKFYSEVVPENLKFWNDTKVIGVTNRKLPALLYIDDRAVRFDGYWDKTIQDIANFKTYQEK